MKTILLNVLFGLTFLCLLSSCETKIGDCRVYQNGNEIFVEGFNYAIGVSGINQTSFNIDFDKLDEYIYNKVQSASSDLYNTLLVDNGEDEYGNKEEYTPITIGIIDVEDSKRYTDYEHWHRKYNTTDMFYKDKREYDRQEREALRNLSFGSIRISGRYMPKSIK